MRARLIDLAKRVLPARWRARVVDLQRKYRLQWPRSGSVRFGDLHRDTPISPIFGMDRGLPIDRYYIEQFLFQHSGDIRGRVLELGDASYTRKFGGGEVGRSDVLHVCEGNPDATIVADLTDAGHIPSDQFDCIIFTQSLQMIYDLKPALATLHRILKPGGVLLLTSHGISKIARRLGRDDWGEYWRITAQGAATLFAELFPGAAVTTQTYGNVFSATCFLHGLAAEELTSKELDHCDADFEVIVAVRAAKSNG